MQAINSLGSNMAIVFPFPDNVPGRRPTDRGRLTMRDALAIERQVDGVTAIAPQLRAQVQIVSGGRSASTEARGATPGFGEGLEPRRRNRPLHQRGRRPHRRPRRRPRPDRRGQIVRRL
jgi:hypothetical protein